MTTLVGAIGWGLLTVGAITHVWHHARLRSLLAMHLDHERVPAMALTALEVVLAIGIAAVFLADGGLLAPLALAAAALACGFVVWIARLLLSGSQLPCACSFSEAPTSIWSLGRALCVCSVAVLALAGPSGDVATDMATLATGLAAATAIFVTPEAITWPEASRALMARVEAFDGP